MTLSGIFLVNLKSLKTLAIRIIICYEKTIFTHIVFVYLLSASGTGGDAFAYTF
jgi:hypothetical protein